MDLRRMGFNPTEGPTLTLVRDWLLQSNLTLYLRTPSWEGLCNEAI